MLGLRKRVEAFLLFTIKDDPSSQLHFRQQLRSKLLPLITTTQDVLDTQNQIKDSKSHCAAGQPKGLLPIVQLNLGFSATGLKKLGLSAEQIPGGAFGGSQKQDAGKTLGDPVDPNTKKLLTWSDDFLNNTIDAIILITAPEQALLEHRLCEVQHIIQASVSHSFVRFGSVRPGSEAGHEHFGYLVGLFTCKILNIHE